MIEESAGQVGHRGLTDITMRVVEEIAAIAFALGRHEDAARLLTTATDARERDHKPLSPACRPEVDELRAALGEVAGAPFTAQEVQTLAHSLTLR